MSGSTSETAQALGGATALLAGSAVLGSEIAVLPNTGVGLIFKILPYLAIALGIVVLSSFIVTRLLKRVL